MSFSENTATVIEAVTSMQQQYAALQERVRDLESEITEKTELLDSLSSTNDDLASEVRHLRAENKKLRRRPDGVTVSGKVHVQQTRSNQRNQNQKNHNSSKNPQNATPASPPQPAPAGFRTDNIPPEVAEQLINLIRRSQQSH